MTLKYFLHKPIMYDRLIVKVMEVSHDNTEPRLEEMQQMWRRKTL